MVVSITTASRVRVMSNHSRVPPPTILVSDCAEGANWPVPSPSVRAIPDDRILLEPLSRRRERALVRQSTVGWRVGIVVELFRLPRKVKAPLVSPSTMHADKVHTIRWVPRGFFR